MSSPQTWTPPSDWVLEDYKDTHCWSTYEPKNVIGKGTFSIIFSATKKEEPDTEVAVKVISKRRLGTPEEVEDVRREVQIMQHLAGHQNVVSLKNVYEDKANISLVMEMCSGGDLFERLNESISKKHTPFTEQQAASTIHTILSFVAHCHNRGVIHRDLKPENFLFTDSSPTARLKVTDFGLSCFFTDGQYFTDVVGSPYYMAPEVLRRVYGKEADVWSCGVILYVMLAGYQPFHGDSENKIFEAILHKQVDLTSAPWPKISEGAKQCVQRMLVKLPRTRATAMDILQHPWVRDNGVSNAWQ